MNQPVRAGAMLIALGKEARAAPTVEALGFLLVNRLRALLPYRQAVLVERRGARWIPLAVTGIAMIERDAPYPVWLAALLRMLDRAGLLREPVVLHAQDAPADMRADWSRHWSASAVGWWPSSAGRLPLRGLLLVPQGDALSEADRLLAGELAEIVFHAMSALDSRGSTRIGNARRWLTPTFFVLGLGAMAVPVRLTAVAPATIAAQAPEVVASPIAGVVREIAIEPNAQVEAGSVLVRLETAELEARLAISERGLAVAEADLLRVRQQAFADPRATGDVALKQATVDLRRTERDHAAYLAGKAEIRSSGSGLAIFASATDWAGRPVAVGERIMLIADPSRVRVEIAVPVADAVILAPGARISLILDVDPLHPLEAVLERAAFEPVEGPGGVLSYRVLAVLADQDISPPRIGLTGTARIFAEHVPLGLFLFRRPITALRQWLGI